MSKKRRIPVLQEDVVCNLIPMVDVMFLLLLFFMLSADMSQRELEDLVLPSADQVKEEDKELADLETKRSTINVFHRADRDGFVCPLNRGTEICRDDTHWLIAIRSEEFSLTSVQAKLQELADDALEPTEDLVAKKRLSGRQVSIRGDRAAPYGHIQKLIELCGTVGIYKIEVGAAQPTKS